MQRWKIGELARRTGVSVRTLHHYEALGLLAPAGRTPTGHRYFGEEALLRLQQVLSLRSVGLPLEEIGAVLAGDRLTPLEIVRLHADRLREGVRRQQRLLERLEAVAAALRLADTPSAEVLIETIRETTMIERYYTPEQLDRLRERREALGEERIREVEAEWPRLMERVRAEMEAGTDPADPRVRALAGRWRELVEAFTGGDPGIRQSLGRLYASEERVQGMDVAAMRPLMEYVGRALAAGGDATPAAPPA